MPENQRRSGPGNSSTPVTRSEEVDVDASADGGLSRNCRLGRGYSQRWEKSKG